MQLSVFALYDKKGGMYSTPFFFSHSGQAIRAVMDLLSDNNSVPARHPADFDLWQLGVWNDADGSFAGGATHIGSLVSFLPAPQPVLKLAGE